MSMQKVRLESRDGSLISEVELPTFANGEPDALQYADRTFIRKSMQQTQPPTKNSPETYVEAHTMKFAALPAPAPRFDRVTEAPTSIADRAPREHRPDPEEEPEPMSEPKLRRQG